MFCNHLATLSACSCWALSSDFRSSAFPLVVQPWIRKERQYCNLTLKSHYLSLHIAYMSRYVEIVNLRVIFPLQTEQFNESHCS